MPLERWDIDRAFSPQLPPSKMTMYTRFAAFCDGMPCFDAAAFRMARPEATAIDPQQRLLMEECAGAVEDSAGNQASVGSFTGDGFSKSCECNLADLFAYSTAPRLCIAKFARWQVACTLLIHHPQHSIVANDELIVSLAVPSSHVNVEQLHAGVYVGCMYQEYIDVQVGASARLAPQAVAGSGLSFMVGRLSYTFNFSGPCVSTDTACSSSLVAAHLACKVSSLLTQRWAATEDGKVLQRPNWRRSGIRMRPFPFSGFQGRFSGLQNVPLLMGGT